MKKTFFTLVLICVSIFVFAQPGTNIQSPGVRRGEGPKQIQINPPSQDGKAIPFETVPGDPTATRKYKLENGLTVYLSQYKYQPRLQTYIVTKAGSKNDPADATGLAHYLEHMLFKGTDEFGTTDYAKEKPLLDQIEKLYEDYRATRDEQKRKAIYKVIDSISGEASKLSIANEYDKLMSAIGATGTNAYTSFEQTVYINDIPSNQLEKWLIIESERFSNPVFRIFHTELEAVYEEKNIALDNDSRKVSENLFAGLFRKHQYGTQTVIGTIDHLKNPSLKKIREYYNRFYVPNNMAVCISGDIDFEKTIALIDKHFGSLKPAPVDAFQVAAEEPILQQVVRDVVGPSSEELSIGFRATGYASREAEVMKLLSRLLYNGTAGLLDIDINQKQLALSSSSFAYTLKDYSLLIIKAKPGPGQSLDALKDLLFKQLKRLADGDFPDWMIAAALNDFKLERTKAFRTNEGRVDAMTDAFVYGVDWAYYLDENKRMSSFTKKDIMDFALAFLKENQAVVVRKLVGEDTTVQKIVKPEITPVSLNRDAKSAFAKMVSSKPLIPIVPKFPDFEKDITRSDLNGIPLYAIANPENNFFQLSWRWNMGTHGNKMLNIATSYVDLMGTSRMSPAQIKQEFYKLGCTFYTYTSSDETIVYLEGVFENFDGAVSLVQQLFRDAMADDAILADLVGNTIQERENNKQNKRFILWEGMFNLGVYGDDNPARFVLSNEELKKMKASEVVSLIKSLPQTKHELFYYGPVGEDRYKQVLDKIYPKAMAYSDVSPLHSFRQQETAPLVHVVEYDMKQAEIILLQRGKLFDPSLLPATRLFNTYFGGGMSSIVFQTMRESKALAYSVFSSYRNPERADQYGLFTSYIGTQADKLPEALAGMNALLDVFPESSSSFDESKLNLAEVLSSDYITRERIFRSFRASNKLGLSADQNRIVFDKLAGLSLSDLKQFHNQLYKPGQSCVMILGKKENLDLNELSKYGKVIFHTVDELFGY